MGGEWRRPAAATAPHVSSEQSVHEQFMRAAPVLVSQGLNWRYNSHTEEPCAESTSFESLLLLLVALLPTAATHGLVRASEWRRVASLVRPLEC